MLLCHTSRFKASISVRPFHTQAALAVCLYHYPSSAVQPQFLSLCHQVVLWVSLHGDPDAAAGTGEVETSALLDDQNLSVVQAKQDVGAGAHGN